MSLHATCERPQVCEHVHGCRRTVRVDRKIACVAGDHVINDPLRGENFCRGGCGRIGDDPQVGSTPRCGSIAGLRLSACCQVWDDPGEG